GFIGLGTYIISFAFANAGLPFVFALLLGFVVAILMGTIVGFISLRIEGMYLAIITLGLSEIFIEVFKKATTLTNGQNGLQVENFNFFGFLEASNALAYRNAIYFIILAILVIFMIAFINIVNSPTGRAMLSIK